MAEHLIHPGEQADRAIVRKFHLKWGRAPATQLKSRSVDVGDRSNVGLSAVGEVASQCNVGVAPDPAPHVPTAGTSSVSASNKKVHVDLLFRGDAISVRAMEVNSLYSLLARVPSKDPLKVWGATAACWVAVFGKPDGGTSCGRIRAPGVTSGCNSKRRGRARQC